MQKKPVNVRATTKVVDQKKAAEPWPQERARLFRLHSEAMAEQRANSRREAESARYRGVGEGRRDVLESMMGQEDFRKYFMRSTAAALGERFARKIEDDWRRLDPVMQQQKRFFDMRMSAARFAVDFETNLNEKAVVVTVDLPPDRFHMSTLV